MQKAASSCSQFFTWFSFLSLCSRPSISAGNSCLTLVAVCSSAVHITLASHQKKGHAHQNRQPIITSHDPKYLNIDDISKQRKMMVEVMKSRHKREIRDVTSKDLRSILLISDSSPSAEIVSVFSRCSNVTMCYFSRCQAAFLKPIHCHSC